MNQQLIHNVHYSNLDARHKASLDSLSPIFKNRVQDVLHGLAHLGWQPAVFSGCRSAKEQAALVRAGTGGTKSWHVAGRHEDRFVNGRSISIHGEAADIVDRRYLWGGPAASLNYKFWVDLGRLAKSQGLEWGGDWKTGQHPRDVAHIQMKTIFLMDDGVFA